MSIEERVAKLEVQAEQTAKLLSDIDEKLTALSEQFLKHKGFIGGIIFTVTAVWAVVLAGLNFIFNR